MKMVVMKLGNTPRTTTWSPPLASFPPPALILVTNSSNSLPHASCGIDPSPCFLPCGSNLLLVLDLVAALVKRSLIRGD
jgi:hypothetical protein